MSACYFWVDGRVVILPGGMPLSKVEARGLLNLFCVDTMDENPTMRYGKYYLLGWEYVPFEVFPKEFKTHLLLLGVKP